MKIAYLANVRFPSERAHAVQIFHMCKAFSENEADTTLFVNNIGKGGVMEVKEYFATDFDFKIKRLTRGPFLPKFKPSYYLGEIIFSIAFLFNQPKDFDVIYSRHEWIVWFLSFFVKNEKLIWESHEAKFNLPARGLLKKKIKTIVISEGIFDFYRKYNIPKNQMLIAHDGIDGSFFGVVESKNEARKRLGLPQESKIVMYIGGFDAWKGVETFFEASELVTNVTFVAIGGRPEEVADFSSKYPKVTFLGQNPYSELKDNQQAGDILVIPNTAQNELSEKFTSPLKLFAHMTSGVPLLVSDVSSVVTVTGRDLVVVVEADSAQALADGVVIILSDNERARVGAKELKILSMKYTWRERVKTISHFISSWKSY